MSPPSRWGLRAVNPVAVRGSAGRLLWKTIANIGSPLADWARVASSCRTSQCSAELAVLERMTSAAIQAEGRPLPEKRPYAMT